jgi:4-amino-4-deoxy-L-arabinose transferase-like glycosyltransferase
MIKDLIRKNITKILLLSVVAGVFFFLRLYKLTQVPVFVDEAIYIRWSQIMRSEESLRFIPLSDGKQPLFMWATIPFLKVINDPLLAARCLSVLTGFGTLVGIFALSFLLFSNFYVSLLSSFFYAISPFTVFFDRLALADSMLSMFGIYSLVFTLIAVKWSRLDAAIFAGFSLGGALLTKSPALYFSLLLPVAFIFTNKSTNKNKIYVYLMDLGRLFVIYIVGYLMANILRLGPNFHMIAVRNVDYVYPISHFFTSFLDPLRPFLSRNLEYLWIMGPSILVCLVLVGSYVIFKKFFKGFILLLAWAFIPIFLSSEFSKTMTARYIFSSLPYIIILSGASIIVFLNHRISNLSKYDKILKFSVAMFIFQALFIDLRFLNDPQSIKLPRSERSGYFEDWTSGYGIKEIGDYITQESLSIGAGKQIVVGTEGYFGTLPDGLQIYINGNSRITVLGVGQPVREIPQSLKESKNFGNKTYLVVNDSRMLFSPEGKLKLIFSYPKALRPDGTREHLLLYEL